MPITTGTSTDQNDLLLDFKTWLVLATGSGGAGWTQLQWTAAPGGVTTQALLNVRGPGAGSGKETFINIQTRNDAAAGAYGWAVSGAVGYSSGASWGAQPNESSEVFFNTWQNSISWWAYANDRRFILIAKVSASYMALYGGFFLPFALPGEHPFPLYIGGNYPSLAPYSVSNTRNRFFIDPGDGCSYYLRRGSSSWRKVINHYDGTSDVNVAGGPNAVMWPHRVPRAYQPATDDWNKTGISDLRPNVNGELPMWNCHIVDAGQSEMPGALDGVYAASGFGRSAEQTFTIGGTTYRLFPNVNRSTERDFLAIAEV